MTRHGVTRPGRRRRSERASLNVVAALRLAVRLVFSADRRGATGNAIGQVVSAVAAVGLVVLSKRLLEGLLHSGHHSALQTLWPLFVLAVVSGLVSSMTAVAAQQQRLTGERVQQLVLQRVLDAVARVDLITYESDGFATQLARIERNALSRPLPMVRALFTLLGAGLVSAVMTAVLFAIEPVLPPLMLVAAVPTVLLGRAVSRAEYRFAHAETPAYMRREYLRSVLTRRDHAAEVRAFDMAAVLRPRHRALDVEFGTRLHTHVRRRQLLAAGTAASSAIALVLMLTVIVALVDRGRMTLAEAGTAAVVARLLANSLTRAYGAFGTLIEAAPHLDDLARFFDQERPTPPVGVQRPLRERVLLDNVGFTYPQGRSPALDAINLQVGAGEVVALVGENGSGKSTLSRIIAGLFDPDVGQVLWDGAAAPASDRRASTSLLSQDFGRYALTVADNVALGDSRREPTTASLDAAVNKANAAGIVSRLPHGYATLLGRELDEGTDLSGGQWQRLALARALFRGGDLLVLDEPSAALDPRAESELFDDVRRVLDGRSAVLVSHRFANVRLADRIVVLHEGRIVEQGTHEQLLAAEGRYAELFGMQSAAYLPAAKGSGA